MAVLEIKKYPDSVLREKAKSVENVDGKLVKLAEDMLETMYAAPGIGLAAPQVGESLRIIVFDVGHSQGEPEPHVLINPVITASEGEEIAEEGCLSLPGIYTNVKRAAKVEVKGYDLDGNEVVMQAEGLMARVLQHEIDHLEGKLLIDRLSRVRQHMIKKKLKKALAER